MMWSKRITLALAATVLITLGVGTPARAVGRFQPIVAHLNGDRLPDRATLTRNPGSPTNCVVSLEAGRRGGGYQLPRRHTYLTLPGAGSYCPDLGTAVRMSSTRVDLVVGWFYGRPPTIQNDLLILRDFRVGTGARTILQPSFIGSADFNGDGREDVYEWTDQGDGLLTFLRTAAGTLTPGPIRYCSGRPDPHVAKFDANNASDLVVGYIERCGTYETGVAVIMDNGTSVDLQRDASGLKSWSVRVGDFDQNRINDVVTTGNDKVITHFIGVGNGTFMASPRPNPDRVTASRSRPVTIPVLANDFATSAATIRVITPPRYGRAVVANRRVVYVPNKGVTRADRFVYQLTDDGRSRNATVTISLTP